MQILKRIISEIIQFYYRVFLKRAIIVISIIPFKAIDLDSIRLTPKGKMSIQYFKENPEETYSAFETFYRSLWRK
ncbi:MAG TPA: hypothetical protein VIK72_09435 [Clostridiaceae bacterium]